MLIDFYIARLVFWPLASTLAISAMLLLIIRMVELTDLVFNEGGTVFTIFQVLSVLVPQYLAIGIPVGLLLSVLLTFRRLTLAHELDALAGTGISFARLLKVPMLYAGVLAVVTLGVVGFLQPLASYSYERLLFDMANGALGIPVSVGAFTPLGDKLVIRAKESHHGGRDLTGVFATTTDDAGRTIVLTSERAELLPAADRDTVIVRLFDGTRAQIDATSETGDGKNDVARFETYDVSFQLPIPPDFRGRGDNGHQRELTLPQLLQTAYDPATVPDLAIQAKSGLYRRLSQAAVLLFLPLLGIGLARPPLRSNSSPGLFVALALFVIYNEFSLFAERLALKGLTLQVALLAGFGVMSIWLFRRSTKTIGESPFARVFSAIYGAAGFFQSATKDTSLVPRPDPAE